MTIKRRDFLRMALAGAVMGKTGPALATGFGDSDDEKWTPRPSDLKEGKVSVMAWRAAIRSTAVLFSGHA